jgi:hypothetical protein
VLGDFGLTAFFDGTHRKVESDVLRSFGLIDNLI